MLQASYERLHPPLPQCRLLPRATGYRGAAKRFAIAFSAWLWAVWFPASPRQWILYGWPWIWEQLSAVPSHMCKPNNANVRRFGLLATVADRTWLSLLNTCVELWGFYSSYSQLTPENHFKIPATWRGEENLKPGVVSFSTSGEWFKSPLNSGTSETAAIFHFLCVED